MPAASAPASIGEALNLVKDWADVIFPVLAVLAAISLWAIKPLRISVHHWYANRTSQSKLLVECGNFTTGRISKYKLDLASGSSVFAQGIALASNSFLSCLGIICVKTNTNIDVAELAADILSSASSVLLIGDRGAGKSLVAIGLADELQRSLDTQGKRVLLLTMSELLEALNTQQIRLGDSRDAWPVEKLVALEQTNSLFVLIDAIDEALQRLDLEKVREVMRHPLVLKASALVCRTSYYDSVIKYVVTERNLLEVNIDSEGRRKLINLLAPHYLKGNLVLEIQAEVLKFAEFHALCPLDIHVLFETLAHSDVDYRSLKSIYEIYREFVKTRLRLAAVHKNTEMTPTDAMQIHLELACIAQSAESRIDFAAGSIDIAKVSTIFRDVVGSSERRPQSALTADLFHFGLLGSSTVAARRGVAFRHWRFQDYFVTEALWDGLASGYVPGSLIWRTFIHQELGLFLKAKIAEANELSRMREQAAAGFIRLIDSELVSFNDSNTQTHTKRLSRCSIGQLMYYAGHVRSHRVLDFIEGQIAGGRLDPFLLRSATIGVAFGGRSGPLDSFVEQLHAEERSGGSALNLENIGHQLSYFGDQAFDFLEPSHIQQFGSCDNTIGKLLRQLIQSELEPSWRLDAYTICYLCNASEWRKSARAEVLSKRILLSEAVRLLKLQGYVDQWPELARFIWLNMEINGE